MMARYLYPENYVHTLNLNCSYTYKQLMALWSVSYDTAKCGVMALHRAGYDVKIDYAPRGFSSGRPCNVSMEPPDYVFVQDLGNTDIICPACAKSNRRGKNGETVYLYHYDPEQEFDNDEELFETVYCRACGYWPEAKKVDELQIRLARMSHHSPAVTGKSKNQLRQHVAVSSRGDYEH